MGILELRDRFEREGLGSRVVPADGWTPVTIDTLDIPAAEVERRTRPTIVPDHEAYPQCVTGCGAYLTVADIGGVCRQCRLQYNQRGSDPLPPWRME